jgi:hypothetical protein
VGSLALISTIFVTLAIAIVASSPLARMSTGGGSRGKKYGTFHSVPPSLAMTHSDFFSQLGPTGHVPTAVGALNFNGSRGTSYPSKRK